MEEKNTTPLRQRMIEDMNIRGLCEKTHKAYIRNVKHFASFLGGRLTPPRQRIGGHTSSR